jgi:hypothetical protein
MPADGTQHHRPRLLLNRRQSPARRPHLRGQPLPGDPARKRRPPSHGERLTRRQSGHIGGATRRMSGASHHCAIARDTPRGGYRGVSTGRGPSRVSRVGGLVPRPASLSSGDGVSPASPLSRSPGASLRLSIRIATPTCPSRSRQRSAHADAIRRGCELRFVRRASRWRAPALRRGAHDTCATPTLRGR